MLKMEKYNETNLTLFKVDCLEFLATLPDSSVDLIVTDPPYYKVVAENWDKQWKSKSQFFEWLDTVLGELQRVLKPNGSLYFFAGPHLATEVELQVRNHFSFLNHIIWAKPFGRWNGCNKESLRKFFPQTEHVMFAESKKKGEFAYEPIRAYLDGHRIKAKLTQADVNKACGCQMSGHWFSSHQWAFPSREHYQTMEAIFGVTLKPYGELKAEYKGIKQAQRTFNVTKQVPYTNVWNFKPVTFYPGKHPCEKPLDLIQHIVTASSMPGDTVLDAFVGSGSTAIACKQTGRVFIGCEFGDVEFKQAVGRIQAA